MAQLEATYFHATQYVFDEAARKEIITSLHDRLQDVSVKCFYDIALDVSEPAQIPCSCGTD